MSSITISISDERLQELRKRAAEFQVAPEELARAGVEELLDLPDEAFEQAVAYVLKKNEELYRRLK